MKSVLHLVLKGRWYDMIESGEKKEEYRDITRYWKKRLGCSCHMPDSKSCDLCPFGGCDDILYVIFHRGYTNKTMVFPLMNLRVGKGKPEWGAPEDREVFVLYLGKKVESEEQIRLIKKGI